MKLRGQWVEVDPATWKKRSDFTIAVGFASGNKDAMVGRLMMIAQNQYQALQLGLPVVQPQNIYETMLELTKAGDFASPERFWTDPTQSPPQQQGPNPDMLKLQGELSAKEVELELQQESKAAELDLKQKELFTKAELEKYRIDTEAATKLQLAQMQGQSSVELESHRAALTEDREVKKETAKVDKVTQATNEVVQRQTEQIPAMLQGVLAVVEGNLAVLKAQKRIRRGKDGRAEAVELVMPDGTMSVSPVLRDEQGGVMGTA